MIIMCLESVLLQMMKTSYNLSLAQEGLDEEVL